MPISSINSIKTLGFYASVGMQRDKTTTKESQSSTTGVGSNFNANNIIIDAGGDATLQGSFNAKENISLVGENIKIKAIESTSSSSFKSNSTSVSVSVGTNGVSGGADFSSSKNKSNSTSYENAQINAGGVISITSKGDTQIYGGNIKGNDVILDIGKDLELKSMQNTSSSKGSSQGFGINGSLNSAGGHINMGKSSSDMAKVEEQSSIIGTNSVKGNVVGTFTNEGGLIGNIRQEGDKLIDGGNMELRANKIINKEVQNISNSKSSGWGFNANVGLGDDAKKQEDANKGSTLSSWQKGSMGANASKNESTTSSTTYGTIGSGLIVANTIEGNINRDVNNLASEEKTIINHNLNANLQIDTRVLSTEGREEIKRDFSTAIESGKKVVNIVVDDVKIVINNISNMKKEDIEKSSAVASVVVYNLNEKGEAITIDQQLDMYGIEGAERERLKHEAEQQITRQTIEEVRSDIIIPSDDFNININFTTYDSDLSDNNQNTASIWDLELRESDNSGKGYFGARRKNSELQAYRYHYGVDLLIDPATHITSPVDGMIREKAPGSKGLNGVAIETKNGETIVLFYAKISENLKTPSNKGIQVVKGQVIATAQDISIAYPGTPNHIHLEVLSYDKTATNNPNLKPFLDVNITNPVNIKNPNKNGLYADSFLDFNSIYNEKNKYTAFNPVDYFGLYNNIPSKKEIQSKGK